MLSASPQIYGQAASAVTIEPQTYTYSTIGTHDLKAYVFLPSTPAKNRPAILLFHGGAWQLGDATWMSAAQRNLLPKE